MGRLIAQETCSLFFLRRFVELLKTRFLQDRREKTVRGNRWVWTKICSHICARAALVCAKIWPFGSLPLFWDERKEEVMKTSQEKAKARD